MLVHHTFLHALPRNCVSIFRQLLVGGPGQCDRHFANAYPLFRRMIEREGVAASKTVLFTGNDFRIAFTVLVRQVIRIESFLVAHDRRIEDGYVAVFRSGET